MLPSDTCGLIGTPIEEQSDGLRLESVYCPMQRRCLPNVGKARSVNLGHLANIFDAPTFVCLAYQDTKSYNYKPIEIRRVASVLIPLKLVVVTERFG